MTGMVRLWTSFSLWKMVLGDWQSSYRRCRKGELALCREHVGHAFDPFIHSGKSYWPPKLLCVLILLHRMFKWVTTLHYLHYTTYTTLHVTLENVRRCLNFRIGHAEVTARDIHLNNASCFSKNGVQHLHFFFFSINNKSKSNTFETYIFLKTYHSRRKQGGGGARGHVPPHFFDRGGNGMFVPPPPHFNPTFLFSTWIICLYNTDT